MDKTVSDAEVSIWCVELDVDDTLFEKRIAALDNLENSRARRFRRRLDARRWSFARATLRHVLSAYVALPAGAIRFDYEGNGKPRLNGTDPVVHFNLSHSDAMALIGVTTLAPIGVDVERLRAIPDTDDIAARFFAPGELRAFKQLPPDQRMRGFFTCWTRKEAVIKATGAGLAMPLDGFEVSLEPDCPAMMRQFPVRNGHEDGWTLHHNYVGADYVGAVALRSSLASRIVIRAVANRNDAQIG